MKKWWKSKLLWFNVFVNFCALLESSLHIIADKFSPEIYFSLVMAIATINIVLRLTTNTGLTK